MRPFAGFIILLAASSQAAVVVDQTLTTYTSNASSAAVQEILAPANGDGWRLNSLSYGGIGNFSSTQADPLLYTVTFWSNFSATAQVGQVVTASSTTPPVDIGYTWKAFTLNFDLSEASIVYASGQNIYFSIQAGEQAWTVGGVASNNNQTGWVQLNGTKTAMMLDATPVPEPSTYGLILGGLVLAGAALRRRRKA